MGWKRVAWTGCLAPVLGGCHVAGPAAHDLAAGKLVAHTEKAIQHHIAHDARAAWREVRNEYPRRCFSAEFRDGFLDGYSDYLDRGGDAQPPATPPLRYTRHQKYYTPEGHALLKDYFLGFKYGADVAVATGQRQFLTVPVLLPEKPVDVPLAVPAVVMTPPPAAPLPKPRPMPPSDAPVSPKAGATPLTTPPARTLPDSDLSKFSGPRAAAEADAALPPPNPPLPVIADPGAYSPLTGFTPKLPEPPAEVPSLPAGTPTPPVMDDLPPLPPNHDTPPPRPVAYPDPVRK